MHAVFQLTLVLTFIFLAVYFKLRICVVTSGGRELRAAAGCAARQVLLLLPGAGPRGQATEERSVVSLVATVP